MEDIILNEILGYPLGWIMYAIYGLFKNYGVSLFMFALLTKIILIPVNFKSQKSMAKTRALAPKLEKIKKSYAKNPQRIQEEQMKLQSEEGVNPLSGCLPMLIQFPILFGIVDVVYKPLTHILRIKSETIDKAVSLLNTYLLDNNLKEVPKGRPELVLLEYVNSNPEIFKSLNGFSEKIGNFNKNLFGFIDLGSKANFKPEVWSAGAVALIAIPILSGLIQLLTTFYSQWHQKKYNPSAVSMGGMNVMLYGMSIFYVWFSFSIPSGAAFYWTVSGFLGLLQMFAFNKYFTPEKCEEILQKDKLKNQGKKPSFMQKMMEQQRQAMAETNGQTSLKKSVVSDEKTSNMSRSELQAYNRKLINEARRKMAEKYGEEYTETKD